MVSSTNTNAVRRWLCRHNFHALRPVKMWQIAPDWPGCFYWHLVCEYVEMRCEHCGRSQ